VITAPPLIVQTAESATVEARSVLLHPAIAAALWVLAVAIVSGWLTLATRHIDDDYRVTHSQGVWIAAIDAARAGRLYSPLYDGEHYAGTRYMPMPILVNALAAAIVGDPLIAGKLAAAILMAMVLVVVVVVLRRVDCPWPVATGLAATVVATETGLQAGTTIGGDVLPTLLQLCALALVLWFERLPSTALAGSLAGLAAASKLTGVWGVLAVSTWLLMRRHWRRALIFTLAFACADIVVLGAVQIVTRGGLLEHLSAFSFAGVHGWHSVLRAPNQILYNLRGYASGAVVLFPLAAVGAVLAPGWRNLSLIHLALAYALLLLLVVYADVGTGFNQLLDIVVLIALAAGHLAGRGRSDVQTDTRSLLMWLVALSVMWAATLDLVRTVGFDLRSVNTAATDTPRRAAVQVANIIRPNEQVLVEDPSIDVALGRRPPIMDPFMVNRLGRMHPDVIDPLVRSIADRRFDLVVLVVPLENHALDFWWSEYDFGPRVAAALRSAYRYDRKIGRYHLYRPVR